MGEPFLEFRVAIPKYKNQAISLNNTGKWLRYAGSKIKNSYKKNLLEWYLPEASEALKSMTIEFHLLRHNARTLDSDALGWTVKWTIDAIQEAGYLVDDDQVTYTVFPAVMDRDLTNTEILVKCFKNNGEKK